MAIKSIQEYLKKIEEITAKWMDYDNIWFRGQPLEGPLVPKLFRESYDENSMVQAFRNKAPALGETPNEGNLQHWLFLMQHFGLPTRLLDWTESALIGLFFAVVDLSKIEAKSQKPLVWILSPKELNKQSISDPRIQLPNSRQARLNFGLAFGQEGGLTNPVAISGVHFHSRMSAQKSCFTIHGVDKKPIEEVFKETLGKQRFLECIYIDKNQAEKLYKQLFMMGISYSTVYPDFSGLARELAEKYKVRGMIQQALKGPDFAST